MSMCESVAQVLGRDLPRQLRSLHGALRWLNVSSEELTFSLPIPPFGYVHPPRISMPTGFSASLTVLDATSNPMLAPVKEPSSGLELLEKGLLPDSIGRAAPQYDENRSIVRCDILQYRGTHAGPGPSCAPLAVPMLEA